MTEPLRVLHINSGNLYGGVETLLGTFAECRDLVPDMVPEFALCFEGRQADELRASGAAVHSLGAVRFSRPWTVWRARRALRKLLASGNYDAVLCHQHWVMALFGQVVAESRAVNVAFFHGVTGDDWIARKARRVKPDLMVAPSRYVFESVARWSPEVPRVVIKNPLTVRFLSAGVLTTEERDRLRMQYDATPETVVILMASRLENLKGLDLVVRALGELRELPHWRFWFAGEPQRPHERDYFDTIKKLAYDAGIEGRVSYLGERRDMPQLMQAADIYTQGNRVAEGFGLSLLEATYSDLPVVTTTLGAAGEAVDAGSSLIVPPEDASALAGAFKTLITTPALRQTLAANGRASARRECDTAGQMNKLAQALHDAVK